MLTEEQLEIYGGVLVPVFQQLEQDIIADIARRVRKEERWTETAELQAEELRRLGWSPYRIRIEVMRRLQANQEYAAMIERNTLEAKAAQQAAIDEAREAAARAGAGALRDRGEHGVPQRPFSLGAGGAAAHARRRRGPDRARDAEARDGRYTESHADDGFFPSDRQRAGAAGVYCGAEQRSDAGRERDGILSAGVRQRRAGC